MKNDLELINWLKSGRYRIPILKVISNQPKIPSELSTVLNINRASVSRILKDLRDRDLIAHTKKSAKRRLYFLTSEGKRVLEVIYDFDSNDQNRVLNE